MMPVPAAAQDQTTRPVISELVATTTAHSLLVFATLTNGFTDTMRKGVKNGIPVAFTFHIECEQLNPDGTYEKILTTTTTHRLSYDSLKGLFLVEKKGGRVLHTSFSSMEAAEKEMSMVNALPLLPLSELQGTTFRLRMQVDLVKKTLPFKLHVLLPFFALWDFETDWKTTVIHLKPYVKQW